MTRAGAKQQKSEAPNQLITASQSRVSIPTECGQRFPTALASTAAILRSIPDLPAHPQSSTHHLGWQEAVEPVPPWGSLATPMTAVAEPPGATAPAVLTRPQVH